MLFNFRLMPLELVVPWGEPGEQRLHWFGLTDGEYWVQVGADALFEYSEGVRRASGSGRYCNYQVARLYEDITEMLPYVLDPVPTPVVRHISGVQGTAWWKRYTSWFARRALSDNEDQFISNGTTRRRRCWENLFGRHVADPLTYLVKSSFARSTCFTLR